MPWERDLNEKSKSASTATERDSAVNEDTMELAIEMSSGLGQNET